MFFVHFNGLESIEIFEDLFETKTKTLKKLIKSVHRTLYRYISTSLFESSSKMYFLSIKVRWQYVDWTIFSILNFFPKQYFVRNSIQSINNILLGLFWTEKKIVGRMYIYDQLRSKNIFIHNNKSFVIIWKYMYWTLFKSITSSF